MFQSFCGASLFDLSVGDPKVRPDKTMGYQACLNSEQNLFEEGNHGAGTGASVGKVLGFDKAMKSGIGMSGIGNRWHSGCGCCGSKCLWKCSGL